MKKILIIAGSDSGGGAGIQGDIKTVTALGGYAATAITALTAQNTLGVQGVCPIPPAFIKKQIASVLSDIGADAVKTGMLNDRSVIDAVVSSLKKYNDIPLVVDPVMIAKGGALLLKNDAVTALKKRLIPLATVLTPNIPEAEALTGLKISDETTMIEAARALLKFGCGAVLVKGGHLSGDIIYDVLVTKNNMKIFSSKRIKTRNTHGTGCTLASAIATFLAQKYTLENAVAKARTYVQNSIKHAPTGIGKGHGPLWHGIK